MVENPSQDEYPCHLINNEYYSTLLYYFWLQIGYNQHRSIDYGRTVYHIAIAWNNGRLTIETD